MSVQRASIKLALQAADSGSPVEGELMYNSTSHKAKLYNGSAILALLMAGQVLASDFAAGEAVSTATANKVALRDGSGGIAFAALTASSATVGSLGGLIKATAGLLSAAGSSDVTAALGFTPANQAGDTFTGTVLLNGSQVGANAAVTQTQLSAAVAGITAIHAEVSVVATTALPANTYANGASGVGATLTATANGALTVDGYALALNDDILVQNEAAPANNGVYRQTQVGDGSHPYILTRRTDFDAATAGKIALGAQFFVNRGTVNVNTGWAMYQTAAITVGTTALTFAQTTGLGDIAVTAPIAKSGNTLSLNVDGTTIDVSGGNLEVKAGGIGTTQLATGGVTDAKLASTFLKPPYTTNIGDGSSTSFTVTHSIGREFPHVSIYDNGTLQKVEADVTLIDANSLTVGGFSTAPTSAQYKVVVTA